MMAGGALTSTVSRSGPYGRPRHRCGDGSNTVMAPGLSAVAARLSSRPTAAAPAPTIAMSMLLVRPFTFRAAAGWSRGLIETRRP